MNQKEKCVIVLQNLFMSVFFGIVFTTLAQIIHTGGVHLTWFGFWLPVIFAAIFGYLIIAALPIAQWGVALGLKLKAKPGSFLFGLIVSFVISVIFAPIMVNVMGIFSAVIIPSIMYDFEHVAPVLSIMQDSLTLQGIPLFFLVSWLLSLLITKPLEALSRKILKTPKPNSH